MSEALTPRRSIHVVAGLVFRDRRICITRRHAKAHQGGKWEFPGGKLEAGETPSHGLTRELREELGIDVQQAEPFMQVRHSYSDLDVSLDIWSVLQYTGIPHGRESQEMRWADIEKLHPNDFPDADRPVLRRLQLPPLYVISDVGRFGVDAFADRLEQVLAAGARLIQLREPHMGRESFCACARKLASLCHRFDARLLINADPTWLSECEADGIHLSSRRLSLLTRRPVSDAYWVGASCHNAEELRKAKKLGADFAVLGSIQPTTSHPGTVVLGWDSFAELNALKELPIYAIGGIKATDINRVLTAGGVGVAMITGIWDAPDPAVVVRHVVNVRQVT